MIKVENLTKTYGDLLAIDDLSFSIEKGRIWGLLGPNAAGKTTTMRILAGYLAPTEGNATVAEFDVLKGIKKGKGRLGYLPEYVPLYPEMTVTEYLLCRCHQADGQKGTALTLWKNPLQSVA